METVLLPPFFTEAVILDGETSVADLIKIFAYKILEHESEAVADTSESKGGDESEEDDETTKKMEDRKASERQETDTITSDCNDILAFLQSFVVKAPRVANLPLSLHAYRRISDWFRKWSSKHFIPLTIPPTSGAQDHLEIT